MTREIRAPRPDYIAKIEKHGLTFHTLNTQPYWCESAVYRFEPREIGELENATDTLQQMCLAAAERIIECDEFDRLDIPLQAREPIRRSWRTDPPALYGRFDLVYDGQSAPKLLEYNADTPTSLLEAAVIQWHWLQEVDPDQDQFNSIWEGLVAKWQTLMAEGYIPDGTVHFTGQGVAEDFMTVAVLMDTASEAKITCTWLPLPAIGWDHRQKHFVDTESRPIQTLFKLYPWEWILTDTFGPFALESLTEMQWIEPIWKMVLSNKGILAVLWEMFPNHPNLLEAYADAPRHLRRYVRKPFLGREGANVTIHEANAEVKTGGPYDKGRHIFQAYQPLPVFDDNHVVIGSWVIDGKPRGIGVRESDGPITEDHARFVPHYFTPVSISL